jgi:hypothetical protein
VAAAAAELKLLSPVDRTVLRGTVEFKIRPTPAAAERIVENPVIALQDEMGAPVETLRTMRTPSDPVCSVSLDTRRFPDGRYHAAITYRTLKNGAVMQTEEDLVLGIRNSTARPAVLGVQFEDRVYRADESCVVVAKVTDARRRPLPGARATFKVDRGELDQAAGIADSDGEITVGVSSDQGAPVTLTVTPEGLPAVTKTIRFSQP